MPNEITLKKVKKVCFILICNDCGEEINFIGFNQAVCFCKNWDTKEIYKILSKKLNK